MSLSVRRTPTALRDLGQIGAFIGKDSLRAELRFYRAAEETIEKIAAAPGLGIRILAIDERLHGLRRVRIGGFGNYLIFYQVAGEELVVVRVLHGARDIERILDMEP